MFGQSALQIQVIYKSTLVYSLDFNPTKINKKRLHLRSLILWWAAVDCLARSRLTAIPCFAYRFSIFGKSTPASAHSRSNHKKVVLILLTALKKDRNKSYPFLMGRSGLEPPTSPLSGVRSNHLS